jgi:hypothetical protein
MRKLALIGLPVLVLFISVIAFAGGDCSPDTVSTENITSSCVTCHSDKDLLMQAAAPVKEVKSEATSGEG